MFFKASHLMGKKWSLALLEGISINEGKGFNMILARTRKISPRILAGRLKEFEDAGILEKKTTQGETRRTSYSLTQKGKELLKIMKLMKKWNSRYSGMNCENAECIDCPFY